jgi:hypothetical protein
MRNLLALAAAGLLAFAAVGWYLGWYQVKNDPTPDGHRQVTIDVNSTKITEDLGKGKTKLHDLLESKGPANPGNNAQPTGPAVPRPSDTWARPGTDGDTFSVDIPVPHPPAIPEPSSAPSSARSN